MKHYTNEALKTIQENTAKLYMKLAETKPSDDLTRDDIQSLMYYIKSFQDMARTEEHRRKLIDIKNRIEENRKIKEG